MQTFFNCFWQRSSSFVRFAGEPPYAAAGVLPKKIMAVIVCADVPGAPPLKSSRGLKQIMKRAGSRYGKVIPSFRVLIGLWQGTDPNMAAALLIDFDTHAEFLHRANASDFEHTP